MTEPATATATALIDAAESLFASDGIERASLREVMRQAGTDPGAVHYHFGGRKALAAAVLDRTLVPLNRRRLELLTELETAHKAMQETVQQAIQHATQQRVTAPSFIPARALVEALIRPDIEAAHQLEARGSGRGRLIGTIYLQPAAFVTTQVEDRFGPVAARFHPHLIAAVPAVSAELLGWRVRWCLFGTLGAVLSDPGEAFSSSPEELTARLVDAVTAALAATPTSLEEQ